MHGKQATTNKYVEIMISTIKERNQSLCKWK